MLVQGLKKSIQDMLSLETLKTKLSLSTVTIFSASLLDPLAKEQELSGEPNEVKS